MPLPRRIHRRTTLLTLYALVLSVAVAFWGAEYKMEQYPQQGLAFRVMSPAKLLTEKERPASGRSVQAVLGRNEAVSGASPAPAARAEGPRAFPAPGKAQPAATLWGAGGSSELTFFFFRPPPARMHS